MLRLTHISKKYGNKEILKNINITFRKKEFACILGSSGSGKSTLLHIIGGMDPNFTGELAYGREKISNWNSYRNHYIGFVFQEFYLFLNDTVLENVQIGLELRHLPKEKIRQKSMAILKKVGLQDKVNCQAKELSGGQKQRVALARALVLEPKILLADEATASLDSKTGKQIMKILEEYAQEHLVIFITHNELLAYQYGTRIIKLEKGEVIYDSNPYQEIFFEMTKSYSVSLPIKTKIHISFSRFYFKRKRYFFLSFLCAIGLIGIFVIFAFTNGFRELLQETEQESIDDFAIILPSKISQNQKNDKKIKKPKIINQTLDETTKLFLQTKLKPYISHLFYEPNIYLSFLKKEREILKRIETPKYYTIDSSLYETSSFQNKYPLLIGKYPKKANEIVLVIPANYEIADSLLDSFFYEKEEVTPKEFLNKEIFLSTLFSTETTESKISSIQSLKIVGIMQEKVSKSTGFLLIDQAIIDQYRINMKTSPYYQEQLNSSINLITKAPFTSEKEKTEFLDYLVGKNYSTILIYSRSIKAKQIIQQILANKSDQNSWIYIDEFEEIWKALDTVLDSIKTLFFLIAIFCFLITSFLIGFIASFSFFERKKETGILRSLGAKEKDVKHLFYLEMIYFGFLSFLVATISTTILFWLLEYILNTYFSIQIFFYLTKTELLVTFLWSIFFPILGSFFPIHQKCKRAIITSLIET